MRILLFPLLFVLSCADGQAEEKCEAFQLAVCDALDNNCDLESQDYSEEECQELLQSTLECVTVVDIAESYEDCIDDLQAFEECPLDDELPPNCEGVLLIE